MNIDIIICTYNRAKKLRAAMENMLKTKLSGNDKVKLVIVNNNSSDETENIVKKLSENGLKVEIKYLFEKEQGKSYALNTALKHVTGDIIAFTDDDVAVDKDWVRAMVDSIHRYPQYNCFGGKAVAVYPEHLPQWLDIKNTMRFLRSALVDRDDGDLESEYGHLTVSKTPGGVNMFFRRTAIEENGPFRTDLGPKGNELGFSEDTEYCQRLMDKGEKFMYIPSVIVYHPVHAERLNKKYLLNWQFKCGRFEVRRNGGYRDSAKVFGVPRYLFRKFMQYAAGWGLSLQVKKRFFHRLRLYYTAGEIMEHFRISFKNPRKESS